MDNGMKLRIFCLLMLAASVFSVAAGSGSIAPVNLRCEYLTNPQGIDVGQPRLSWLLESRSPNRRGLRQSAWQILVASSEKNLKRDRGDLWDSGKVESDQSIQVEYAGSALASRQACFWKVRVWDQDGQPSSWSQPAGWVCSSRTIGKAGGLDLRSRRKV